LARSKVSQPFNIQQQQAQLQQAHHVMVLQQHKPMLLQHQEHSKHQKPFSSTAHNKSSSSSRSATRPASASSTPSTRLQKQDAQPDRRAGQRSSSPLGEVSGKATEPEAGQHAQAAAAAAAAEQCVSLQRRAAAFCTGLMSAEVSAALSRLGQIGYLPIPGDDATDPIVQVLLLTPDSIPIICLHGASRIW
jgi:hypothetical protein